MKCKQYKYITRFKNVKPFLYVHPVRFLVYTCKNKKKLINGNCLEIFRNRACLDRYTSIILKVGWARGIEAGERIATRTVLRFPWIEHSSNRSGLRIVAVHRTLHFLQHGVTVWGHSHNPPEVEQEENTS